MSEATGLELATSVAQARQHDFETLLARHFQGVEIHFREAKTRLAGVLIMFVDHGSISPTMRTLSVLFPLQERIGALYKLFHDARQRGQAGGEGVNSPQFRAEMTALDPAFGREVRELEPTNEGLARVAIEAGALGQDGIKAHTPAIKALSRRLSKYGRGSGVLSVEQLRSLLARKTRVESDVHPSLCAKDRHMLATALVWLAAEERQERIEQVHAALRRPETELGDCAAVFIHFAEGFRVDGSMIVRPGVAHECRACLAQLNIEFGGLKLALVEQALERACGRTQGGGRGKKGPKAAFAWLAAQLPPGTFGKYTTEDQIADTLAAARDPDMARPHPKA